jgi:hypothetical protein
MYRMNMKFISACLLILSVACLLFFASQSKGEFSYIFRESTGENQFILINGKEVPIEFSKGSDPTYLNLLNSLSWRVLYCEENEKKIRLIGSYNVWNHKFTLNKWYWVGSVSKIASPEMEDSNTRKLILKKQLTKDDFESGTSTPDQVLATLNTRR